MLIKMIKTMFLVVLAVAPALAMAGVNPIQEVKSSSLAIEKSVFKDGAAIQLAKVEQEVVRSSHNKEAVNKVAEKDQSSTPVSGWFLFSALLGFVLLSNRLTI